MRRGTYKYKESSQSRFLLIAVALAAAVAGGSIVIIFPAWFFIDPGQGQPDLEEPTTTLLSSVDGSGQAIVSGGTTSSASMTFFFSGTDNVEVARFEGRLDTGPYKSITNPVTVRSLTMGTHYYFIRAVDTAGNVDTSPISFTWSVGNPGGGSGGDTTPPDTVLLSAQESGASGTLLSNGASTEATAITFTFTGTDNVSVKKYEGKLDGGSFTEIISPATITGLAPGQHTYVIRAVDATGNVDSTPIIFTWTVIGSGGGNEPNINVNYGSTVVTFCMSGCDYNNLQTAINALPAGGGTVQITSNSISGTTYQYANPILLRNNIHLLFDTNTKLQFTTNPSRDGLACYNCHDLLISNPQMIATQAGIKAMNFQGSYNIIINGGQSSLVRGVLSTGFLCQDCHDVLVDGFYAKTSTRGISIGGGIAGLGGGDPTLIAKSQAATYNIWVINSQASDISVEGIRVNGAKDAHLIGNTVWDTSDNGLDIGFNDGTEVIGNKVTNGGVPAGDGIHTDRTKNALIKNNEFITSGKSAINVCGADGVRAVGNKITNPAATAIVVIACSVDSKNTTLDGNIINTGTSTAIFVSANQANTVIVNNIIEGYTTNCIHLNQPNTSVTQNNNTCITG